MRNRPFRILHVEDDDVHARLVRESLSGKEAGIHVDRAVDGEEALAYIRSAGRGKQRPLPDLILLDLKLPKVDGHEFLQVLKQDASLRVIPVVVLTTSDKDSDRRTAYASHANSYLVKPMNFAELKSLVAEVRTYWAQWNCPSPENG